MKKLWNDWSGPVAFTLGWTLLLAAALLMPNVPVWADPGGTIQNCTNAKCNVDCQGAGGGGCAGGCNLYGCPRGDCWCDNSNQGAGDPVCECKNP